MRSRNIKPGFLESDLLAECSFAARLLFIGLWMIADREGRLEDRPLRIKGQVFRFDDVDVDKLLNELAVRDFVRRYEVGGSKYLWITKFHLHQRPHRNEVASKIPPYSGNGPSSSDQNRAQSALNDERGMMNEERGKRKDECSPNGEKSADADETDPRLLEWIDWWNDLKRDGVVAAGVSREPISEEVKKGWNRYLDKKEVRQLLSDRDVLAQEIAVCGFLREGWFTLAKLLGGKNRDGAYIAKRILEGGYRNTAKEQLMSARPLIDQSAFGGGNDES